MNPSPKKPTLVVLAVVLCALAAGALLVWNAVRERRSTPPVPHAKMEIQAGGASIQFPVSLDTQQAASVDNWSASATGATEPVSVLAATVGTDDRTVFLEILHLKPGMQLKVRYSIKSSEGADLRGALTGTVGEFPPILSTEKDPPDEHKNREEQR